MASPALPERVSLSEARRFLRDKDRLRQIKADPSYATPDEIVRLVLIAERLSEALDAEQESMRLFADEGIRPY